MLDLKEQDYDFMYELALNQVAEYIKTTSKTFEDTFTALEERFPKVPMEVVFVSGYVASDGETHEFTDNGLQGATLHVNDGELRLLTIRVSKEIPFTFTFDNHHVTIEIQGHQKLTLPTYVFSHITYDDATLAMFNSVPNLTQSSVACVTTLDTIRTLSTVTKRLVDEELKKRNYH